ELLHGSARRGARGAAVEEIEEVGEPVLAVGQLARAGGEGPALPLDPRQQRRLALAGRHELLAARALVADPGLGLPALGEQAFPLAGEIVLRPLVALDRGAVPVR